MTATAEYEKAKQTPPTDGDTVRVTYETTLGWINGNRPDSPGVVHLGYFNGQAIKVQPGKDRKIVAVEIIDPDPSATARARWVEGYEWALSNLTHPGVLADAHQIALGRDQ